MRRNASLNPALANIETMRPDQLPNAMEMHRNDVLSAYMGLNGRRPKALLRDALIDDGTGESVDEHFQRRGAAHR